MAIALVTAVGTAIFVMSLGAIHSLEQTQSAYYDRYHFADVFASVRRAPESLVDKLAAIPGVKQVSTRIIHNVVLDIEGMSEPVNGLLSSLPEAGGLNQLHLRRGPHGAAGINPGSRADRGFRRCPWPVTGG